MNKEVEEWRDVPEYEGYYQVSNMGRVRSLDRTVTFINGREQFYKGQILDGAVTKGYKRACLNKDSIRRTYSFSQLVAMAFLGHIPNGGKIVVDHVNGDKLDDRIKNLRIVTQRANCSTCFRSDKASLSSEYIGVCWNRAISKWHSYILYNGGRIHLGFFTNEIEASNAYQSALSKIKDGSFIPNNYKDKWTSNYKGVYFHKASDKWVARIRINGRQEYLGIFPTELEAHHAYQKAKEEQIPA